MPLMLSSAVESLLVDAPTPEVRAMVLRAGAPQVLAALEEVASHPEKISTWEEVDAALLVSLLQDPTVLARIQQLDLRPEVASSVLLNEHTPESGPGDPSVPDASLVPPGRPTLAETRQWVQVHGSGHPEFNQWLVEGSPDPLLFLTEYAKGTFGMCSSSTLFFLQNHEDVMTLETFFSHVPRPQQNLLLDAIESSNDEEVDVPMLKFLRNHQKDALLECTYTPAARTLLQDSPRPMDQAVFLLSAPESETPDIERFQGLSATLQATVLLLVGHPDHQRAYVPFLEYTPGSSFDYDPAQLLREEHLDFPMRLPLLRWANSEEILQHLQENSYTPDELDTVIRQVFSDLPQLMTGSDWMEDLDECSDTDPIVAALVETTIRLAPGLVGYTLETPDEQGVLVSAARRMIHAYCGSVLQRWESVLSLGPDWKGTLPELLECIGLTGDA